ncbi:MAG: DUF3299 domain-containing protein [Verrucomicrobiales bacterium]
MTRSTRQLALVISALSILVWGTLGSASGVDEAAAEITWDDLLPKEESTFDDPFASLTEEQLLDLGMLARIRFLLETEKISADGPDAKEEKTIVARLAEQGIDADYLISQRERVAKLRQERAEAVDTSVAGKKIKLPGYMLPLKREAEAVTEFLLVPWVGACIHTPPPPPNQMVHVRVPGGTPDRGRFAAIWIEGTLALEPATYELFLVDGKRDIKVAYTMELVSLSEYSSTESDTLAMVDIPDDLAGDHSWMQRLQNKVSLLFTKTMTDIKDQRTSGALLAGLLTAFIYGVLHTLGPGHGKAVVISYFVGEKGSMWRGVRMGSQIALFHVLSAIVVVWVTDFAIRQATGKAPSDYRFIKLVSYAAIMLIGTAMLVRAIRRARIRHDHSDSGENDHHHHDGCHACEAIASREGSAGWLALAVGSVPCTGALLVLLFGMSNDLLLPAILMVVAISFGMAVAMSGIGVLAILGRNFVDQRLAGDGSRQEKFANAARIFGAAVVVLIGGFLFILTLLTDPRYDPPPAQSGTGIGSDQNS